MAQSSESRPTSQQVPVERRQNARLRELIDEMMASVRVAARRELWTEAERRQYEGELADIMQRVRFEAVWK